MPMIVRWPGKIRPGSETDLQSAFWDFLPTACQLAGTTAPDTDGISYLPTLLGTGDQPKHEYLYWASSEGKTAVGVRHDDWKLVQYRSGGRQRASKKLPPGSDAKPEWRLYNLSNDISEKNNVADQNPKVVEEIVGLLRRDELVGQ